MKVLVGLLLAFSLNATACEHIINGPFTITTYRNIEAIIESCKDKEVKVFANSLGGDATLLLQTMDKINSHRNVVWIVEPGSACLSSCAWTAIASREVRGKLYFHGIRNEHNHLTIENLKLQLWVHSHKSIGFEQSSKMVKKDFWEIEFK